MAFNVEKGFGAYTPAFGMVGTLIGLIVMLGSMGSDPDSIGTGMAVVDAFKKYADIDLFSVLPSEPSLEPEKLVFLASELNPKRITVGGVQRVLQNLLQERVSIRDLRTATVF